MRVLDPSGAATDLIRATHPDAEIDQTPDGLYDVICFYADLDNQLDPDMWIQHLTEHIGPGGKVYVGVQQGRRPGGHTFGRKRAWRSVDVAALMRRHGQIEAFGVDETGMISGSFTPCERRGEVTIFTGRAIGPWHPQDIVTKGLGGSETAAWRLAEELSGQGYIVNLYGEFDQQGAQGDVILRHWLNFDPTVQQKATIVFRTAEPFDKPIDAQKTFLWLEDVAGAEGLTEARAENITHVCTVSDWHTGNLEQVYPWLDPKKIVTSRNGITHAFFQGPQPEREKRVLYTSSPDRGLDIVLECWPEIHRQVPDAELVHCYSRWWDLCADVNPHSNAFRAKIEEMSRADGVRKIGSQGQKDLALLMRSSLVWCHPSYWTLGGEKFNETNCISVQEAQAAGCRTVSADWGAVGEMNKTGVTIAGDPNTPEWRDQFIGEIVQGLTDPDLQEHAQTEGPKAMETHGWDPVARQLKALIGG